jgi:BirA family transcriptional regulator, biotin operon repressor / biotin---[acetyl-CoA-carboxylase] ligase
VESVEALGQDSLRRAVLAAGVEAEPTWLDETGSTNTDALRMASDGAPEWTVVATGHQTAGRGRIGRSWSDEPGSSLLVSVIFRPKLPPQQAPLLSLLAAVAMIEACKLPSMRSKWPNDLNVGDRKVGGILAEASMAGGQIGHVVVGLGLNLASSGLPDDRASTSLQAEGGSVEPERILRDYLSEMVDAYVAPAFPDGLVQRYAAHCATVGKRVRASLTADDDVEGLATGLDESGALLVETSDGVRSVAFGEVTHLRPI